jgi:hypothetical protein
MPTFEITELTPAISKKTYTIEAENSVYAMDMIMAGEVEPDEGSHMWHIDNGIHPQYKIKDIHPN